MRAVAANMVGGDNRERGVPSSRKKRSRGK